MTADDVFQSLENSVIVGGGVTDDGIHFFLKDGRILVLGPVEAGEMFFGVAQTDKRNLN